MDSLVLVEVSDGIATLTFNKPDRFNAFDPAFIKEIRRVFEETLRRSDVDAVVLTGAGKAFCAGGDLNSMKAALDRDPQRLFEDLTEHLHPVVAGIRKTPKPIVAALNGAVAGGGIGLALACDVRVGTEATSFTPAYGRLGICPDGGLTFFLPRLIGFARAQRMIHFDETVKGEEAQRIGLVDRLVPGPELLAAARSDAARLAAQPPETFRLTKELLNMSYLPDVDLQLERERRRNAASARGPWLREGVNAFFEKRAPVFRASRSAVAKSRGS